LGQGGNINLRKRLTSAVSRSLYPERRDFMLKLSILIGIPSVIAYLGSIHSQHLENILYIFVLSAAALLVAILSQINEKSRP
jgi:hypothetical protein